MPPALAAAGNDLSADRPAGVAPDGQPLHARTAEATAGGLSDRPRRGERFEPRGPLQGLCERPEDPRMKALFWKDLRVNQSVIMAAAVFFVIPFAVVAISELVLRLAPGAAEANPFSDRGERLTESLMVADMVGLLLSQLILAALGANALACERADRSAEFLFALPIERGQMLVS